MTVDESAGPKASTARNILLTGASGYVGGRLRRVLERAAHRVRCFARHPENLRSRVAEGTEIVAGDAFDPASIRQAMEGIEVVYYLIHSLGSKDFEAKDRQAAENFAKAAADAGVRRIIYLGGLAREDPDLSPHLRSRMEVGHVLREGPVPVIEFRASIIVGSGSLSFDLMRALVERLPFMLTPKWILVEAQPIAIRNVISYLEAALDLPTEESRIYEIGGADRVTYKGLMKEYARQRNLQRVMITIPIITTALSRMWLGLVTPLYARVGAKLIDSIRHSTVVHDTRAREELPVEPMGMREAIERALAREERHFVESHWFGALSSGVEEKSWAGVRFGNRLADRRSSFVDIDPDIAFRPIQRIGGRTGWYAHNFLWRLRGFFDLLVGGVGMRRGRQHPVDLHVGDALDFWRVSAHEPGRLLRLRAEMKLPGRAWLEFEVRPEEGGCRICQTALFDPVGLAGLAYWYLIYPIHAIVFRRMLAGIVRAADREARASVAGTT